MKIVLMEPLSISPEELNSLGDNFRNAGHEFISYDDKTTDESELIQRGNDADVLIIANNPLPGAVISELKNLKMISVAFVGIDHVDVEACKARDIRICNAAGYCTHAVAELAIGLTLSVLRNIPKCDQATRVSGTRAGLVGNEFYGKTFGIIGTGEIGLRTAEIAKVFGCKLKAYSRTEKDAAKDLGIEYVSLEELLKTSDIVSLHTPLTAGTKHLLHKDNIKLMKPTSILINTARGPIVNSADLAEALNNGTIAGAGLDVFDIEPPLMDSDPLANAKNTVVAPHVAFATKESMLRRASIVFDNVLLWIEGTPQKVML